MAKWYKLQSVLKAFKHEKNEWVWMLGKKIDLNYL